MKIDASLATAVRAAAKHQPAVDYNAEESLRGEAIAKFLRRRPALKKRIDRKLIAIDSLQADLSRVKETLWDVLKPFGLKLCVDDKGARVTAHFHRWDEDSPDLQKFKSAGGIFPPSIKPGWKPDRVFAELARAEPKDLNSILAKYGINWE